MVMSRYVMPMHNTILDPQLWGAKADKTPLFIMSSIFVALTLTCVCMLVGGGGVIFLVVDRRGC